MSGKHQSSTPTVKFPHRSRRGVLLGLTVPQLTVAGLTGLLLLAVILARGVVGALQLIPLWAVIALLVFVRHRGRALADWAPIVVRYALRRMRGQLVWLTRPSRRPTREGLLHLPGTAASLRVTTAPDGKYGAVHNPHTGTLTAAVKVSSRAYALLDPGTQQANVGGWGRALAALARTGQIARIQVIERTIPDSGDALRRYWEEHGRPDTSMAGAIYNELIQSAGPAAAPHEAYVAVSLDPKAARRLINQAGGGLTGAFSVLAQLTSTFDQAARTAGLTPTGWLTAREIAAVVRTSYDPKTLATLDRWSTAGRPEAEPAAAGPVVVVEKADHIATDSAVHATYWVENWPRTETSAGFLHQLLFTGGVRRTLSLSYEPKNLDAALRDVQRKKSSVIADAAERARRGQVDSEADSIEYQDIKSRERQLIAGHADVALTGLLTVSANTEDELRTACAVVETAAVGAQLDLRPLTWQQAEAFTAAALPLALAA
ncbi:SCO6880 family protein [Streptomyces glycanivorans]|uniref:Type VII secretion protein EccE n=1 Tax=Streptomyces glycanivorans TaxID=3033808 RepID=A0ABY9J6E9_9ACTN|nr:SCO6880 family protein [Streptomyces sp. Alt3]WLQ63365.1 type VII secretion protein EccE [Streptomyces sp. Alt3]